MMRKKLVAGNWKMNGLYEQGMGLAGEISRYVRAESPACDVLVCPPFTLIGDVADMLQSSPIMVGAQDCHEEDEGAFTGSISAAMLHDSGAEYVIVGHSERRTLLNESSDMVRKKAGAAHRNGLKTIICLGETFEQRESNQTLEVLQDQLTQSCPDSMTAQNTVIAYEPVWAIGTGKTATTDQIAEAHASLRSMLGDMKSGYKGDEFRILYGGSVKPSNATEIFATDNVDGGLIGGASLIADDFCALIGAASGFFEENDIKHIA